MTFWSRLSPRRQAWLFSAIVLLVALLPRLYHLGSAPPGLSGDEMFNAVDALPIGRRWPIYLSGNNGREVLFFYLMALSIKIFGLSSAALRLPAALLGAGSALLAFWLGRDRFNLRVGLLSGLLIAASFWPIIQSRWALRAISLTFFTVLTLYFYTRAWRDGRRRDWLAAGLSLGLSAYTYIPSRVFPLVVVGWLAWAGWQDRSALRRQWRSLAASFGLALLVFSPYGWFMFNNPAVVNQRIDGLNVALDQALDQGNWAPLSESVGGVLKMFSIVGDNDWRYHLAEQPIFDPITSIFFYLGLGLALLALIGRWDTPARRPLYFMLLLWLAAMLGPNAILEANPSFLRAAGAIVPVYLLTALGADAAYSWLHARWPRLVPYAVVVVGLGLLLTFGRSWRDYFGVWSNHPETRAIYNAELATIGQYLDAATPPAGTRVFAAYEYVYDITTMLAYSTYTEAPTSWFVAADSFAWSADGPSWYLVPAGQPLAEPLDQLAGADAEPVRYANGDPALTRYALTAPPQWEPSRALGLSFRDGPDLIGYDLPESLTRGAVVPLILHWQIPPGRTGRANEFIFIQVGLEDSDGNQWGAWDALFGYPQESWQTSDRVVQLLELTLPDGMPPGPIFFRFDLRTASAQSLPRPSAATNLSPAHFLRGRLLADFQPAPAMLVFDNQIALRSATFSSLIAPGLPLDIALDWVALAPPVEDYRVQLSLALPGAAPFATQIFAMWPDTYPPTNWMANEPVTTFHRLNVPLDMPTSAPPELRVTLLPVVAADPLPISQGSNKLADLALDLRERLFTAPPISRPVVAQFGDAIRLLGYDLDAAAARPGGELRLTLYWQAIATPARNYTVFNHLIGLDGNLLGQFDSPPTGPAWLTQTWLPGEIVIDERVIPISTDAPAGTFPLAVGLYDSQIVRLPVTVAGAPQPGDQLVLELVPLSP